MMPWIFHITWMGNNNIKFTIEFEQNDEIPFLDVLLRQTAKSILR